MALKPDASPTSTGTTITAKVNTETNEPGRRQYVAHSCRFRFRLVDGQHA